MKAHDKTTVRHEVSEDFQGLREVRRHAVLETELMEDHFPPSVIITPWFINYGGSPSSNSNWLLKWYPP